MTRLLSCCLMLLFCTCVAGNEKTATYSVLTKNTVSASGDIPEGSTATYLQTYNRTYQITKDHSSTLTLTGFDGKTITGITLMMKSNANGGAGSLSVTCGSFTLATIPDSKFNTPNWNGEYTGTFTAITPEMTPHTVGKGEEISIIISASENSLYCNSFSITYSEGLSSVTIPTVSLASGDFIGEQHVWLRLPEDGSASSIHYTTDGSDPSADGSNAVVVDTDTDILVASPTTIKAMATNSSGDRSAVVSRKYNVIIPDKTTRAALTGEYSGTVYAMSSDNMKAVAVTAVNGKVICNDDNLQNKICWNIHETGDSAIIENDLGEFLTGGNTQALSLGNHVFKWAAVHESGSWQYSDRTFLCGTATEGFFDNCPVSTINKGGNQTDWTKACPVSDGHIRSGLSSGQLATVCLPCEVAAGDFRGAGIFEIAGVVKASHDMTVNDITGVVIRPVTALSAGTPYLLIATDSIFVAAYSGEKAEETASATGLVGNLSGEKVAVGASDATHWTYVIHKNSLYKVAGAGSATIANNRAYIDLYGVEEYSGTDRSVQTIPLSASSTGIEPLSATAESTGIYLTNGQRVPADHAVRGVYIRNGKKYTGK